MQDAWTRIEGRLAKLGCLDRMQLQQGAASGALHQLERHLGIQLPASVKSFLSVHDGQAGFGLMLGERFLSTEGIRTEWDVWRSIDEEEMNRDCAEFMKSQPEGVIKVMYTNRLWIPLTSDAGGNHIGLDYDPDHRGRVGQVISFGRDEDTKRLLANDFDGFVEQCISWLDGATWNGKYLDNAA
jgi:cell wall assembly regulator SMI1